MIPQRKNFHQASGAEGLKSSQRVAAENPAIASVAAT